MNDEQRLAQANAALAAARYKEAVGLLAGNVSEMAFEYRISGQYCLGRAYLNLDEYSSALHAAEKGLEEAPHVAGLHMIRAASLDGLDLLKEAEEAAREAIRLDPDQSLYMLLLSNLLLQQKRVGESLEVAERAVEMSPEEGENHLQLARALYLLDRNREAEEAVDRALSLNPESDDALYLKGVMAEGAKGAGFLRRALRLKPDEKNYRDELWTMTWGVGLRIAVLVALTLGTVAAWRFLPQDTFEKVMNGGYLLLVLGAGAFLAGNRLIAFPYFAVNFYMIIDAQRSFGLWSPDSKERTLSWVAFLGATFFVTWLAQSAGDYFQAIFRFTAAFVLQAAGHVRNGTLARRITGILKSLDFWIGLAGALFGALFPVGLYTKSSTLIALSLVCLALPWIRRGLRRLIVLLVNGAVYYLLVAFVYGIGTEFRMPLLSLALGVAVALYLYCFLYLFYSIEAGQR